MSSVWCGFVSFGMVNIPVKLHCAARSESIGFKQLRRGDLAPIGQKPYVKTTGEDIAKEDIIKGYETAKGWVVVDEAEIKALAPESAKIAEIAEFVPATEIDPMRFETSYWMEPDKGGDKAYALLFDGMKRTGQAAIAKLTMHNREHVIALRPATHGIAAHTLYYDHEARAEDEHQTDTSLLSEKEIALAERFIKTMSAHFDASQYEDGFRERVLQLIASKEAGTEGPKAIAKKPISAAMDLTAALTQSLAAVAKAKAPETKKKRRAA